MNADRPDVPGAPRGPVDPPTILNVNDDTPNRFAMSRMLAREGFRVEEASDGNSALRKAAEGLPDLVVLDVDLPDVDGFEVCRRIKADPATSSIPVLHISARYVRDEDRTHGLTSGADGYLIQPVEPMELIASIRGLLRMRRAEDAVKEGARRIEQLESELRDLGRRMADASEGPGAGPRGAPLREGHPGEVEGLVERCGRLLDLAIQRQKYRVEHDISAELREIGERLGTLGAGPRDVVDVYGEALRARSRGVASSRARAYLDEGRLLVLELMGHLVSYYRDHPSTGRPRA